MRRHAKEIGNLSLATAFLAVAAPAFAQEGGAGPEAELAGAENPPPTEEDLYPLSSAPRVYYPEDFERFAPRNALDLIDRIPNFSASGGGGGGGGGFGGGGGRGFGEASGNLLINGDRISSKSTSTRDQLSRIPVGNVVRIEIVDGATLEIPGLSGRVANIIVEGSGGLSGQFSWRPRFSTGPRKSDFLQGNVSVRGSSGPVNFTIAADMGGFAGGDEGVLLITDAEGVVDERDYLSLRSFRRPTISGIFAIDVAPDVKANLNLSGSITRFRSRQEEIRILESPLPQLGERFRSSNDEYSYEIGGDIEFPLGPGRFKLIGLESFEDGDFLTTSFADHELLPTTASRFGRDSQSGERIARGEYSWQLWGADWQFSGEAAFNRLDNVATLFGYDVEEEQFFEISFPGGTGGVREDRYEAMLSFSRPVTDNLSLQLAAGGEYSTISQTGDRALSRTFKRPKGTLSLAWAPADDLDISLEVARRVGQLDFGDFLASVNLTDDQQSAGNVELRPQQSWESELEINKSFGRWGSGSVRLFDHRIEDLLVIVPVEGGGEARGNLDSARRYGLSINGTLELEALGWQGAQLDFRVSAEESSLVDPVTGIERRFDRNNPFDIRFDFRHDVPDTNWAYGFELRDSTSAFSYRVRERSLEYSPITFGSIFVENKDVFGLTVRAQMSNIFDGYDIFERTVFDTPRGSDAETLFTEFRRTSSGQNFQLSISGSF